MDKEQALKQIQKEFQKAEVAGKAGNEGMVRVCARRAAGVAISFWLQANPRGNWGIDAMNQLHNLQRDESFPEEVRHAALRLTTKVTAQFTSPFAIDPLEDSKRIIDHLFGNDA